VGSPSEKVDLDENGGIILKWIFKEMGVGAWTGLTWRRIRTRSWIL
jgi:hypothetical protein